MGIEHLDDACRAWLERLVDGSEAESDEELARIIAEHIAECPTCAASEAALSALIDRYRRTDQPSLPEHLERRLLACLTGSDPL